MSVLITGGAGFIGSFTAKRFAEAGRQVIVVDNLSTGSDDRARWGHFYRGDIRDTAGIREIIRCHGVTAVVHLGAGAHVGESIANPAHYYSNNVSGTIALLDAMLAEDVRQLVFASSCSVYGNAVSLRIREDHTAHPVSPYGESKLVAERAIEWYGRAYRLRWMALRYFNVAGADAQSNLGEDPDTSERIVPRAWAAVRANTGFNIYGTDFDTPDGTCVRDYVHVRDIANANLQAVDYLETGRPAAVVNLGTGIGLSVRQIVDEVASSLARPVLARNCDRRPGDVPYAVADVSLARQVLSWEPEHLLGAANRRLVRFLLRGPHRTIHMSHV